MQNQHQDDEDEEGGGVAQPDLIKSYLAFGARALRAHSKIALGLIVGISAATIGLVSIWPRTFACVTVMATQEIRALDSGRDDSLSGIAEVITNRDNLVKIVKQTELAKLWEPGLPPILRLKYQIMSKLRGPVSEQAKAEAMVGLLQSRLMVTPPGWNERKFSIAVEWYDGETAAKLAKAAQQSFLDHRRSVEVTSISDSISIRENYAKELSEQITRMRLQLQAIREEKLGKLRDSVPSVEPETAGAAPAPRRAAPAPALRAEPDPLLAEMRLSLETKQRGLKDREDARDRRVAELQSSLLELRARYTPAHPQVTAAEANIASLSQDSPQVMALRAEIKDLQGRIKQKSDNAAAAAPARGAGGWEPTPAAASPGATPDPLTADVLRLMQDGSEDIDPALGAEFNASVSNYSRTRDDISKLRTDLQIAQEAFARRYYVVIPAEVPPGPIKPSVPKVVGIGVAASILLGLLVALLAELRKGRVVEKWQVYQLGLPILAEMRWPPGSDR